MSDLSLVETADMITELERRFEACVFMGLKKTTSDTEEFYSTCGGSYATCLGLLEHLKNQLMTERIMADTVPFVIQLGEDEEEDDDGEEFGGGFYGGD